MTKINFSKDQIAMLNEIGFDFDVTGDLTDEQLFELEDRVGDHYNARAVDKNGQFTELEPILGSLLDVITAA